MNGLLKILNNNKSNILSINAFKKIIEHERERSIRGNHYFTIIVFEIGNIENKNTIIDSFVKLINKRKRGIDEIGWLTKYHIGIILPYTEENGARIFIDKILNTYEKKPPDIKIAICTKKK